MDTFTIVLSLSLGLLMGLDPIKSANVNRKTCETDACKEDTKYLLEYVNQNLTEKCQGPYLMGCKRFLDEYKLTGNIDSWNSYAKIFWDMLLLAKTISNNVDKKLSYDKLDKKWIDACNDMKQRDKIGLSKFRKNLDYINANELLDPQGFQLSSYRWHEQYLKMQEKGFNPNMLLGIEVGYDREDYEQKVITLTQPHYLDEMSLSIGQLRAGKPDDIKPYREYLTGIANLLGAKSSEVDAKIENVITLEKELAKIRATGAEAKKIESQYHSTTPSKINRMNLPSFPSDFTNFLNEVVKATGVKGVTIGPDDKIVVKHPKFISSLANLLKDTKPETLSNFVLFKAVTQSIRFLTTAADDLAVEFYRKVFGVHKVPVAIRCSATFIDNGQALATIRDTKIVKKLFSPRAKAAATELAENVRTKVLKTIERLSWMDPKTEKAAKKKVNSIELVIGYAKGLDDNAELEKRYQGLIIDTTDFHQTFLNVNLFSRQKRFEQLGKRVSFTYMTEVPSVSWFADDYYLDKNYYYAPVGFLTGFYGIDRHSALNYAQFGFNVARNLFKAVGAIGQKFDEQGNTNKLWSNDTMAKYEPKAKCISKLYGSIEDPIYPGKTLNGDSVKDFAFADNIAETAAFEAWSDLGYKNEGTLPNQPFSVDQVFLLAMERQFCAKYTEQSLYNELKSDRPFPPQHFRGIGLGKSSILFLRLFGCRVTAKFQKEQCNVF